MADRIPYPVCIFSGSCGKNLYTGPSVQGARSVWKKRESWKASRREREAEGKCESAAAPERRTAAEAGLTI